MEKLRQKLEPGVRSSKLTPLQRRKKSDRKQKKLYNSYILLSVFVHSILIVLIPFHISPNLFSIYFPDFLLNYFQFLLNAEILLALVCIIGLAIITFYTGRILGNWKLAKTTGSDQLRQHTYFIFIVTFSLLFYYSLVILSEFFEYFHYFDSSSNQIHYFFPENIIGNRSILRLFEIFHDFVILAIIGSPSLSLLPGFPSKAREITQDWLTTVLRDNGISFLFLFFILLLFSFLISSLTPLYSVLSYFIPFFLISSSPLPSFLVPLYRIIGPFLVERE